MKFQPSIHSLYPIRERSDKGIIIYLFIFQSVCVWNGRNYSHIDHKTSSLNKAILGKSEQHASYTEKPEV